MKFTWSWLKDHIETEASPEEICEALPRLGFPVASFKNPGKILSPFHVVHIQSIDPHPQSDHLKICLVDTGSEHLQVVCGAPNARSGLKTVLARPGDVIPESGLALKKSVIRGISSEGMLCSARELKIGTDHNSIIEVEDQTPIGTPFLQLMHDIEPIIEIEVTPNRGDLLSVHGIARELHAAGLGTLIPCQKLPPPEHVPRQILIQNAKDQCTFIALQRIEGVSNGPSPQSIRTRLESLGSHSISALVDISNYWTFDRGQPTHIFDADLIQGPLSVTLSQGGETFEALNGTVYTLPPGLLVITDTAGILSLAGLIGGTRAACHNETKNILIESAIFCPQSIALAGRTLKIQTEARSRFERGVDPKIVLSTLQEVQNSILITCGGKPSFRYEAGRIPDTPTKPIIFHLNTLETLGGITCSPTDTLEIFKKLGFQAQSLQEEQFSVTPPSWRQDIEGPSCLVEEILRIKGYDCIPSQPLICQPQGRVFSPQYSRPLQIKKALAAQGLYEVVTWSFVSSKQAEQFGGANPALRLINPISQELAIMRPHIFPHLLTLVKNHLNRSLNFQGFFEIGPIYSDAQTQNTWVVGIIPLTSSRVSWQKDPLPDVFHAKAHAITVFKTCDVKSTSLQETNQGPPWYHPGRVGSFFQGKRLLGNFGQIHPQILKDCHVNVPCAGFCILLDNIPISQILPFPRKTFQRSAYQPVTRDLSFILENKVTSHEMLKPLRQAAGTLLVALDIFDYYPDIGPGEYALGIRVTLQSHQGTLSEDVIEKILQHMIHTASQITGARLRT